MLKNSTEHPETLFTALFDWLIFVHQRTALSKRGCFFYCLASRKVIFVHPMNMGIIESWLEALTQWKIVACLLWAICACSWNIVPFCGGRNVLYRLCRLVPAASLICKQVRYCNIYSIIWLANFQFKFYIRERSFIFFI